MLDSYPLTLAYQTNLNGAAATITTHIDARDPGTYLLRVTVTQADGQTLTTTTSFAVHLLEATITE